MSAWTYLYLNHYPLRGNVRRTSSKIFAPLDLTAGGFRNDQGGQDPNLDPNDDDMSKLNKVEDYYEERQERDGQEDDRQRPQQERDYYQEDYERYMEERDRERHDEPQYADRYGWDQYA